MCWGMKFLCGSVTLVVLWRAMLSRGLYNQRCMCYTHVAVIQPEPQDRKQHHAVLDGLSCAGNHAF